MRKRGLDRLGIQRRGKGLQERDGQGVRKGDLGVGVHVGGIQGGAVVGDDIGVHAGIARAVHNVQVENGGVVVGKLRVGAGVLHCKGNGVGE
mmetsp:Transcript_27219/g.42371  ORF Transcript_27219/g.42371 Transcript_27219/m.42371 type:complete len:92 (-) Transcript_27219:112-387(-)